MFHRFAAASAIAAIVVGVAALVVVLIPGFPLERFSPVMLVWCFVPAAWGLWAMLAPRGWVPERFALWGAILGVIGGLLGAFVLNLPARVAQQEVPASLRVWAVPIAAVIYYLLWLLVRRAYRSLSAPPAR
jgi:hypothetical protein